MCWAALIDGRVILHWFEEGKTVNQQVYLDMLQSVLWPKVARNCQRKQYWMQQDGARCHTTALVLDWWFDNFGDRVISNLTDHVWPPRSPDLSPLDFWFWGACMAMLRKNKITTMNGVIDAVNEFAASIPPADVRKSVRDIYARADACISHDGGAFEHSLKRHKRNLEE